MNLIELIKSILNPFSIHKKTQKNSPHDSLNCNVLGILFDFKSCLLLLCLKVRHHLPTMAEINTWASQKLTLSCSVI